MKFQFTAVGPIMWSVRFMIFVLRAEAETEVGKCKRRDIPSGTANGKK